MVSPPPTLVGKNCQIILHLGLEGFPKLLEVRILSLFGIYHFPYTSQISRSHFCLLADNVDIIKVYNYQQLLWLYKKLWRFLYNHILFAQSFAGWWLNIYWAGRKSINVSKDPTHFIVDICRGPIRVPCDTLKYHQLAGLRKYVYKNVDWAAFKP